MTYIIGDLSIVGLGFICLASRNNVAMTIAFDYQRLVITCVPKKNPQAYVATHTFNLKKECDNYFKQND